MLAVDSSCFEFLFGHFPIHALRTFSNFFFDVLVLIFFFLLFFPLLFALSAVESVLPS